MSDENKGDFFVMLYTQNGNYTPLENCIDIASNQSEFARFQTKEEARDGALDSVLGERFGYEVFEIGCGED